MDGAIRSWYHHLGGPASPQSRHKIVFTERVDSWNYSQFCSDMLTKDKDAWNSFMSYQTAAVTWIANEGNHSSTGYWDHGKPWDTKLNVGLSRNDNTVHELGHVMGLAHEMKRTDRNKYIYYQCNKLDGFYTALQKAQRDYPATTEQQFCDNSCWGYFYESPHVEYPTDPLAKPWGSYDLKSIMHYGSKTASNIWCHNHNIISECPLAKWIDPLDHSKGLVKMPENFRPTGLDALWIKFQYPWETH